MIALIACSGLVLAPSCESRVQLLIVTGGVMTMRRQQCDASGANEIRINVWLCCCELLDIFFVNITQIKARSVLGGLWLWTVVSFKAGDVVQTKDIYI